MQRLIFLAFLVLSFSCSRPAAGPDHLVIALNPVECVSCIKNMELLFKNTNTFPVVFVFEEKYRKDSAGIIQSMALRDYHGTYVWSDSLFALSSMYGISAVSLVSGKGEVKLRKQLKILTRQDITWIRRHRQAATDTLLLPGEATRHAYETIFTDGRILYCCASRKMKIDLISLPDGKYIKTLQVGPNDVKAAFTAALGPGAYDINKRELARLNIPNQEEFVYYSISDSCLVAVAAYTCIAAVNKGDTVVAGFYAVHTFRDNITEITVFPDIPFLRQTFLQDGGDLISCNPAIHYYRGAYFGNIRKSDTTRSLAGNRFLAKFNTVKDRFRFLKIFDDKMPDVYKNGNNSFPLFYKGYCMLPLANRIYSLDGREPLELKGLTFKVSPDFFTPPDKYIVDFLVEEDQVTLVYHVQEKQQYHLLRYDLKKEQILFDKVIPAGHQKPVIDRDNPDYVYYEVPGDRLVRQHHTLF